MADLKRCEVCGVTEETKIIKNYQGRPMCSKHRKQMFEYGKITDPTSGTTRDRNEIIMHEDYAEMIVKNKKNEYVTSILLDKEDVDHVLKYKWNVTILPYKKTYANARINGKTIKLHRYILDYYGDQPIDHINRNIYDNRKSNLRIATNAINSQNRTLKKNNVYTDSNNTWRVSIIRYGTEYSKRGIKTKEEAEKIRDEMITELNEKLKNVS